MQLLLYSDIQTRKQELQDLIARAIRGEDVATIFPLHPLLSPDLTAYLCEVIPLAELRFDYLTLREQQQNGQVLPSKTISRISALNRRVKSEMRFDHPLSIA